MSDDPFDRLDLPAPPPGLREAALRAGRQAFGSASRLDAWSRLLASVPARVAWAASVALLLAAHAFLPASTSPPRGAAPGASRLEPEVSAVARLPRIEDRALAARTGERS
jgi:hypothetical protein